MNKTLGRISGKLRLNDLLADDRKVVHERRPIVVFDHSSIFDNHVERALLPVDQYDGVGHDWPTYMKTQCALNEPKFCR